MKGAPLPLKTTDKIDFVKAFGPHIKKQYGDEAWKNVESTFVDMTSIRNSLDFSKMSSQLQNDFRLAQEFEGIVLNYTKYAMLVDKYFSKDFAANKNLQCPYMWTNSFQPSKKVKSLSLPKYEVASSLYNLAIIYYTQGIYSTSLSDVREKLKGIAKLTGALWCISEIKQLLPSVMSKTDELPTDMSLTYISLLGNYFTGIAYSTLIGILSADSKTTAEKLAILNKAAAKYFQMAYDLMKGMKDCPLPEKETKYLKANLHFNYVIHDSEAMFRRASIHLEKVDDEILAGHMGYAVSYLRIAKANLEELVNSKKGGDLDYLTSEQKEELEKQYKLIVKGTFEKCELRNAKVYQQKEFKPEQLPEIPEETNSVSAKLPSKFSEKIGCESLFDCFLSPEIIALKREFGEMINQRRLNLENSIRNFLAVKEKGYSESYVNYFLNLVSQANNKKVEIPKELKAKIDKFRTYGGSKIYAVTRESIVDKGLQASEQVEKCKMMISKEKAEDDECRKTYANSWKRAFSEQLNQDYVFKVKELEQKFFIAQNADQDIFKKYDQNAEWMKKFEQTDEELLKLFPQNLDSELLTNYKKEIEELIALDAMLSKKVNAEIMKALVQKAYENFLKTDFIPNFVDITSNKVKKEETLAKLISPLEKSFEDIETELSESYPILDKIISLAKTINSKRSDNAKNSVKIIEEMNLSIAEIIGMYDDMNMGANFYFNLALHLNNLEQAVAGFCMARTIEKEALIQDLQANKNYNQINVQNAYFVDNQFPQGTSVFGNFPSQQTTQKQQTQNNMFSNVQTYQQQQQSNPFVVQQQKQQQQQTQLQQQQQQQQQQIYQQQQQQLLLQQQKQQEQIRQQQLLQQQQQQQKLQQQQQKLTNVKDLVTNVNATSTFGYMPLNDPLGGFGGNIVESTIIPNPNQKK